MGYFWVYAVALFAGFTAFGTERESNVVGGSDATISDAPWQAFVVIGNKFCGGVVISSRWVLTAAHCLDRASDQEDFQLASANDVSVYTGTTLINGDDFSSYLSAIDAIYVNSAYDKTAFTNDIGLIKLAEDTHENAKAIQLADLTVQQEVDATANQLSNDLLLTGWGYINANRTGNTNILQKAMLSTISDTTCAVAWGTLLTDVNDYPVKYFCAQAPSKGACNGDSGGPLVWFDPSRANDADGGAVLVGLVSFGVDSQCASPTYPDVYTQVSNYRSWIINCMEGRCSSESSIASVISVASGNTDSGGGVIGSETFLLLLIMVGKRLIALKRRRKLRVSIINNYPYL